MYSPSLDKSSELIIEVKHDATFVRDQPVGIVRVTLGDLLADCVNGEGVPALSHSDFPVAQR